MSAHVDILDDSDRLGGYFVGALLIHVGMLGLLVGYQLYESNRPTFGEKNAGGAAVGVEAVKTIPLAHHGAENPVANDTPSTVPETPVKAPEKAKKEKAPPPDAVALKSKKAKKEQVKQIQAPQRYRPFKDLDPNQLTSKEAPQISSSQFSAMPGAGRIGTGSNTTLGDRCGGYAALLQQLVGQKWQTGQVDGSITSAPTVIVTFDLQGDGNTRNVQLLQRSGVPTLDSSVQRAILDASPFPPIPAICGKSSARVEFWFELKR